MSRGCGSVIRMTTSAALGAYLLCLFGMALFFSRRESLDTYFLNKRKTSLWLMTFSTVATVVGAGGSVAIVAEVQRTGISYGLALPISFVAGMIILGCVASKIRSIGEQYGATTIVDFFGKKYDRKTKLLTGILQIFLLIIWIAIQAIAMASVASVLTGFEYHIALTLAAIVTILYTAIGGLKIDILTDFVQFWIILFFFLWMAVAGYQNVGGFAQLFHALPAGHLNPFAFGGVSWFTGVIVLSGFIFLGNTTYWQRILSAENERVARQSFFLAIPFVFVLGIIILFLGLVASTVIPVANDDTAVFALMSVLLRPWMLGIGLAAMLAVIMSSVDSLLVGGSAILYGALFGDKQETKNRVLYARFLTALFGACGFFLALFVPEIVSLSLVVTYLSLIFVPASFAAIYHKNVSANAAFWSLLVPSGVLFLCFPFVKENTFIITTSLSVVILTMYDRISH
ncbi:hypothetical protein COV83_04915 [Candidatus Peregrinibacteria bacterium CG11_big_fil_rev_8_21_14_0_20_49_14]|nr:MAG: hypothetical protein COV83_04915 [Candidatus Peregrinibacteria bacterium CG11_big_fil_rev_8_21_14_0_20_49_14]